MTFTQYTDAVLSALRFNPRSSDVVARKQEILDGVYVAAKFSPACILFVGFNPAILSCQAASIAVTEISATVQDYLVGAGVKFEYIEPNKLSECKKQFQVVVAMDEYFTFAESDADQQIKIANICNLASHFVISTLRDYKNQDFKDRDFSQPTVVRSGINALLYLESHTWDPKDRNLWTTLLCEIAVPASTMITYGPFDRRTMFFKQLARFSMDAGAVGFQVHKNLMYKSLLKKNYEHVVTIQLN